MNSERHDDGKHFRHRLNLILFRTTVVIGLLAILIAAHRILMLFFAAAVLAILLEALSGFIRRALPIGRALSYGTLLLIIVLLFTLGFLLLGGQLSSEFTTLREQLMPMKQQAEQQVQTIMHYLGQLFGNGSSQQSIEWSKMLKNLADYATQGMAFLVTGFGAITALLLIVVVAGFMLVEPEAYRAGALRLFPPHLRQRYDQLFSTVYQTIHSWLLGMSLSALFVAITVIIGLYVLGIPGALVLGLLAGIMTFIPNFGPIISSLPPILIGLSQGGVTKAILVGGLYILVQILEGNVVTPLIQRRVAHLSPVVMLLAQITAALFLGPIGLVMAVPAALVIKTIIVELYVLPIENGHFSMIPDDGIADLSEPD